MSARGEAVYEEAGADRAHGAVLDADSERIPDYWGQKIKFREKKFFGYDTFETLRLMVWELERAWDGGRTRGRGLDPVLRNGQVGKERGC